VRINYLAFRGLANFAENVGKFHPLVIAGHVGIQFEDDSTIYGFHPTEEAEIQAGGEREILNLLKQHIPQLGGVQNDTDIFLKAVELNLTVYYLTYEFSEEEYQKIKDKLQQWYNEEKKFWYNFPQPEGGFPEGQYNCSTFPTLLGIPVPHSTGYIHLVIAAMVRDGAREWKP
jgi:filamentous hemagglutinin